VRTLVVNNSHLLLATLLLAMTISTGSAAPPTEKPMSAADRADFSRIYALQPNEIFKRIAPPFASARLAFFRAESYGQSNADPPAAMTITFEPDGTFRPTAIRFNGTERLSDVIVSLLHVYPQDIDGDPTLLDTPIPGDFIVRDGTTAEQLLGPIQQMMGDELETPMTLVFHNVERPVIVLKGQWSFKPLLNGAGDRDVIQLYASKLTNQGGGGGGGDAQQMVNWLGRYINRPVVLEATGVPPTVSWRQNGSEITSPADATLVLNHLQEQTGLSWSEEKRMVRRLSVERAADQ
jgi:hypothetical protein